MTNNIDRTPIEGAEEEATNIVANKDNFLEDAITDLILGTQNRSGDTGVQSELFYGRILSECKRIIVTDKDKGKEPHWVPTAAVAVVKNQFLLIANLDFLGKLDKAGRRAVIKHEAQHLVHRHLFRFMDNREARPDNRKANIAMDAAINQFNPHIRDMKMSDGKTFPEVKWENIPKATADMIWEEYYDCIEDEMQKQKQDGKDKDKKKGPKQKGSGSGDGEPDPDSSGDDDGDPTDGQFGETVDDHSFFGEIDQETNRDMMEDALKDSIQRTARQVFAGNAPEDIERILDQIRKESKVPWQTLLRNWMKMATQQTRSLNILRESTSVLGVFPGHKRSPVPEFHVYADMSGSVSDAQVQAFFTEVMAIQYKLKATVWVHQFDTIIHESTKLERSMPDIKRAACGGTNFDCIVEHAHKNKNRSLIIFTDGYCGEVDWSGLKVLAAYTKDHHEHSTISGNCIVLDA